MLRVVTCAASRAHLCLSSGCCCRTADGYRAATTDDDDEYGSGNESDQQRSYSGGSPSKGLKLLSGAALQRPRHPGQQAESVQDMQVPRSAAARPVSVLGAHMQYCITEQVLEVGR